MKKLIITLGMSFMAIFAFGQTNEIVEGRIWSPTSFCRLPESANPPIGIRCSQATIYRIYCDSLDNSNYACVWITFQGKNVKALNIKSKYKNISLIRKSTKEKLYPVAYLGGISFSYGEEGNPKYATSESTFKKCTYPLKPKEKYDLFIFFEKADIGDKVVIEDFLETELK